MGLIIFITLFVDCIAAYLGIKIADYIAKPYFYESEKKKRLVKTFIKGRDAKRIR